MILPDVNVLISAFRFDSPHHALCREWLTDVVSGDSRFGIARLALSALVRITTNSRIFRNPSGIDEAFEFCEHLLTQPNCQVIEPGDRHWSIFGRLCRTAEARGGLVTDAWFAALAIEWGCEWVTLDRDFSRFAGLNWRRPTSSRALQEGPGDG